MPAQRRQSQTAERLVMNRDTRQSRQNGRSQRAHRRLVATSGWREQRKATAMGAWDNVENHP
jgi:hypothetical protein